jgi:hypothetical protein
VTLILVHNTNCMSLLLYFLVYIIVQILLECWIIKVVMPSTDDRLGHCKDGNAAHPMENISANEFMQLSLEEEGSDELCGINERMVRDVQKSAIELLAAR